MCGMASGGLSNGLTPYTSRCRFTVFIPSNASAMMRTAKCVSPEELAVMREPACPAC